MIIANAQEPVELECFGSIKCSRDVFKNVGIDHSDKPLKVLCSYFNVLFRLFIVHIRISWYFVSWAIETTNSLKKIRQFWQKGRKMSKFRSSVFGMRETFLMEKPNVLYFVCISDLVTIIKQHQLQLNRLCLFI